LLIKGLISSSLRHQREKKLKINVRQAGRISILDLEGALRLGPSEDAFRERVQQLTVGGPAYLAVNLAHVSDLDSSGVGMLMQTYSTSRRNGGKCVFFSPSSRVQMVLRMVHLDKILDISEDEATALARF
jgi:anti-sigma B factor antagonist